MADMYAVKKETLDNIANAIRTKRDITDGISVDDMAMQIGLISGGSSSFETIFRPSTNTYSQIIDGAIKDSLCYFIGFKILSPDIDTDVFDINTQAFGYVYHDFKNDQHYGMARVKKAGSSNYTNATINKSRWLIEDISSSQFVFNSKILSDYLNSQYDYRLTYTPITPL